MRRQRRRRRLSMTSLIDVIFLLLLFFMLSSTFTRFAEIDLAAAGSGTAASTDKPVFVSLTVDTLRLNGANADLAALSADLAPLRSGAGPLPVLISMNEGVTAQRLTDLLAALRAVPNLSVTVLGAT